MRCEGGKKSFLLEIVGKVCAVLLWLELDPGVLSPVVTQGSRLGCYLAPGDRCTSRSSQRHGVCADFGGDSNGGN